VDAREHEFKEHRLFSLTAESSRHDASTGETLFEKLLRLLREPLSAAELSSDARYSFQPIGGHAPRRSIAGVVIISKC
jgi:hypothetical protein